MATLNLRPTDIESYRQFLRIKQLPSWSIRGRVAEYPDEYAELIAGTSIPMADVDHNPPEWFFDYQKDITRLAIKKRKFAIFADCGLGKTAMLLEFALTAEAAEPRKPILIVCPLMVVEQTIAECQRFFKRDIPQIRASELQAWLKTGSGIGITNYDALTDDIEPGRLGALILDESSMLKSHYGKWASKCLELGRGLNWKLCCTGTPAPNDRIEYANHAVFLDHFPTVNSFLATYFVNKGQTQERWILKPHALGPFYRAISHWCIFLTNPATYGWRDHSSDIPPIHVHIHDVPLTSAQREVIGKESGELFATNMGGITSRSVMGQIAKGSYRGTAVETNKPRFIRELIDSFGNESTLVWCMYNQEQDTLAKELPSSVSIDGSTPYEKRKEMIAAFKSREVKTLISKPKILGFGLNLQVATRQVFSGLQDSYESYYQAVKRSNRVGSTRPLNVHIPVTEIEEPMIETVLRKAGRVQRDTEEQERIFKLYGHIGL